MHNEYDHIKLLFFSRLTTSTMPKYKLTYFNWRSRGEVARLLFVKNGVEFEEERLRYFSDDLAELNAKQSKY